MPRGAVVKPTVCGIRIYAILTSMTSLESFKACRHRLSANDIARSLLCIVCLTVLVLLTKHAVESLQLATSKEYSNPCLGYSFRYPGDMEFDGVGSETRHKHPQSERLSFYFIKARHRYHQYGAIANVVVNPMDSEFTSAESFRYHEWYEYGSLSMSTTTIQGGGWDATDTMLTVKDIGPKHTSEWIHIPHGHEMITLISPPPGMRQLFLATLTLFPPDKSKCTQGGGGSFQR